MQTITHAAYAATRLSRGASLTRTGYPSAAPHCAGHNAAVLERRRSQKERRGKHRRQKKRRLDVVPATSRRRRGGGRAGIDAYSAAAETATSSETSGLGDAIDAVRLLTDLLALLRGDLE